MAFGLNYQIDYLSGWRYIFSSNYREHAKQIWGSNRILQCLFLVGYIISILLTSAAAVLLIQLFWFLITSDI